MLFHMKDQKASVLENDLNKLQKDGPAAWADLPEDELFTPAGFSEERAEATSYSNYSYWGSTFRAFFKNRVAVLLLVALIAVVAFAFLQPYLPGQVDPNLCAVDPVTGIQYRNIAPGQDGFIWGSNSIGQDLWSRLWQGTRTSLLLSLAVAFFEVGLGVIIGAIWGFYRKLDTLMFAIYNTLTNVPSTIYLVLIAYIMKPSIFTIMIALVATGWISEARWFRSRILALREADYNIASICLKTPPKRIISRNVVPYLVSLIIMDVALTIPSSIGSEVFLSFIGVGLPADLCTLGNLVNQGRSAFLVYPYQMICPTLILCFITISFYIIGNKFADASDPRNHV